MQPEILRKDFAKLCHTDYLLIIKREFFVEEAKR